MNNNQYNRNRMVTRSRVQPGHLFVAIESKHKQSKPKQSKQGTQLRESSNDSLSGSYSEQILLLETLRLEALKVNLTTTAAIEKMREYIRDGPPPPLIITLICGRNAYPNSSTHRLAKGTRLVYPTSGQRW
jgi:hypothetical protein